MKKLLVLVVLTMILSAACSSQPTSTATIPPAGETQAAPPTTEPSSQATAPSQEETRLRANMVWPMYIDPGAYSDFTTSVAVVNLYDTLVFPNKVGGMDPWLAESWDVADDGLTFTFHLRQGVTFHDGSELLASDVVYTFNRLQTIGEGFAYMFKTVDSVTALDDYSVQFKLTTTYGPFLGSLVRLYILNEDEVRANTLADGPYGDEGDYGREWLVTHDSGSGPYKIRSFQLEEYLEMEKFDDWWGEFHPNAPDVVRYIGTTETTTVRTMFSNGELEVSDVYEPVEALEALDKIEGVEIATFPTASAFYYMMNTHKAPTDDIHCRLAITYAFDYEAAVALEWPGTLQMIGPVPRAVLGHDSSVVQYHRDLDKAREELALCKYGATIDQYPVGLHWTAEVPTEEKWALLFQANMAEIGIKVDVVQTPWLNILEESSTTETSPNFFSIYVAADLPEAGVMLQQRYHSSTANTWMQNEDLLDPELDAAIDDALSTTDEAARVEKYKELQNRVMEYVPSLFLYDWLWKQAYRADKVDWHPAEQSTVLGYTFFMPRIGVTK